MVAFHRFQPSRKKLYFIKKPFKKTPAPEMRHNFFDLPLKFQLTEKLSAWSTWVLLWNFYKLFTENGLPDSHRRHMRSELALFCRVKMPLWPRLELRKQNTEALDVIKTLQIRKLTWIVQPSHAPAKGVCVDFRPAQALQDTFSGRWLSSGPVKPKPSSCQPWSRKTRRCESYFFPLLLTADGLIAHESNAGKVPEQIARSPIPVIYVVLPIKSHINCGKSGVNLKGLGVSPVVKNWNIWTAVCPF